MKSANKKQDEQKPVGFHTMYFEIELNRKQQARGVSPPEMNLTSVMIFSYSEYSNACLRLSGEMGFVR